MAYHTDVTVEQWSLIQPLLPVNTGRGRPMVLDLHRVINAIFYVVRTGCQWRNLPQDFPNWSSCYYYFRKWSLDGTWQTVNESVRKLDRQSRGRKLEPSGAIVDSQSVKTTEAGGDRGFDGGKRINGRKRHCVTDTVGNLLFVVVNSANTQDCSGAQEAFGRLTCETITSLKKVWADGGYRGEDFLKWVHEVLQSTLEIATCPPNASGFVVVPVRWVVERTLAWLGRYRRLSKDYEHCTKSSEGVIYVASISTMLKRLA